MFKSIILFSLLFFTSIFSTIISQNLPLFERVEVDDRLYGSWIAPWSIDYQNNLNKTKQYSIYHFDQNDSLSIINNEKRRFIKPVRLYERNDTIYLSTSNNDINFVDPVHLNRLKSILIPIFISQDSFVLSRNSRNDRKKDYEVFYKSKSKRIPFEDYTNHLLGREFSHAGWIACGENFSSTEIINYKFNTDSTYTKSSLNYISRLNEELKIEKISFDTFSYEIVKDSILLESDFNGIQRGFVRRQRLIKQRTGVNKNYLYIVGMDEVK